MSEQTAAEDLSDATEQGASPATSPSQSEELFVPRQVIPASIRVIHWVNALCILLLAATGFLISRTFPLGEVSPAGADFLLVNRQIHIVASLVVILSVLTRFVLAFVGPEPARWKYLFPLSCERRRNLVESLAFYLFLRREHPEVPGHGYNALQGLAYAGLYGMLFLIAVTGLFLVSSGEYVGFWSLGFAWLGGWPVRPPSNRRAGSIECLPG